MTQFLTLSKSPIGKLKMVPVLVPVMVFSSADIDRGYI